MVEYSHIRRYSLRYSQAVTSKHARLLQSELFSFRSNFNTFLLFKVTIVWVSNNFWLVHLTDNYSYKRQNQVMKITSLTTLHFVYPRVNSRFCRPAFLPSILLVDFYNVDRMNYQFWDSILRECPCPLPPLIARNTNTTNKNVKKSNKNKAKIRHAWTMK